MPLLHCPPSIRAAWLPTSRRQATRPCRQGRVAGSRRQRGGEKLPVELRTADTGITAVMIFGAESGRSRPGDPSHPHPCCLVPPLPVAGGPCLRVPSTLRPRWRATPIPPDRQLPRSSSPCRRATPSEDCSCPTPKADSAARRRPRKQPVHDPIGVAVRYQFMSISRACYR